MKHEWTCRAGAVFSGLLAFGMTAATLGTSVMADELPAGGETPASAYRITIENADPGHTYEAYQILTGDLAEDQKTLSNLIWGSGVTDEALETLDLTPNAFAEQLLAENFDVSGYMTTTFVLNEDTFLQDAILSTCTDGTYLIDCEEPGYYLVKDAEGTLAGQHTAYTGVIMQVLGSVNVKAKTDKPTSQKKVKDAQDTEETVSGWQDSADHDFGDEVPFLLSANLPNNVSAYDTYELTFHDTMAKGLSYTAASLIVRIDGEEVSEGYSVNAVTDEESGETALTVAFPDVKALGATDESLIEVEYTAALTEDAKIGSAGNPNEMYLEFSNNPYKEGTGKTLVDRVIVFTYQVLIDKVDENGDTLPGAQFALYKKNGELWKEVEGSVEDAVHFRFAGVDDGDYMLREIVTPDGYNTARDLFFTVTAEHDILSDDPAFISLDGSSENEDGEIVLVLDVDEPNGQLSTAIENLPGSVLPSTGGTGTFLLYLTGASLVAAAGVLTMIRRRIGE